MALLVAPFAAVTAGSYVNANMPFLLQSESYFNIPFSDVGTYSGKILFWAYLVSTISTPGMGYIYDILGRYKVLISSSFILSFVLGIIPYSSPYFWLLCI